MLNLSYLFYYILLVKNELNGAMHMQFNYLHVSDSFVFQLVYFSWCIKQLKTLRNEPVRTIG